MRTNEQTQFNVVQYLLETDFSFRDNALCKCWKESPKLPPENHSEDLKFHWNYQILLHNPYVIKISTYISKKIYIVQKTYFGNTTAKILCLGMQTISVWAMCLWFQLFKQRQENKYFNDIPCYGFQFQKSQLIKWKLVESYCVHNHLLLVVSPKTY